MSETAEQLAPTRIRAVQLALFDEDFALDAEKRAFAHEFLRNGQDGTAAVMAVRPHLSREAAAVAANRWLGTRRPGKGGAKADGDPEIRRYLEWMQARAALRAEITLEELAEKSRRVYHHAIGDLPVRRSVFPKDGGRPSLLEVVEPNLPAANTAIETLRKLGGIGKDLTPAGQQEAVATMSQTERAAKLAALLERAKSEPGRDAA